MEYLVTMTTRVSDGTPEEAVQDIRTREAAQSREVAAAGHLLRLWRLPLQPGEWRTLGLFAAADGDRLEERRDRGTPAGSRALTCREQAILVLRRFRDRTRIDQLGRDHGISRATAYRYVDEGTEVLAARAPGLHQALERAREEGVPFVILDGKLFASDRLAEQVTSVKGEEIDAWYSGKHHQPGGNVQAVMLPGGLPIWTSEAEPGHVHDITAAHAHALPALYRAASLGMPTLADCGYEGAGIGIHVPVKNPGGNQELAIGNRARNRLLRGLRFQGERGFALLTRRWTVLQHTTASPRNITQIVRAALVLTQFEHKYLTRTL